MIAAVHQPDVHMPAARLLAYGSCIAAWAAPPHCRQNELAGDEEEEADVTESPSKGEGRWRRRSFRPAARRACACACSGCVLPASWLNVAHMCVCACARSVFLPAGHVAAASSPASGALQWLKSSGLGTFCAASAAVHPWARFAARLSRYVARAACAPHPVRAKIWVGVARC